MYWKPEIEILPQPQLHVLQAQRLQDTLGRAANSPFYGEQFRRHGIGPEIIKSVDDIRRLPFTTKEDLRNNFPYGFLTVPKQGPFACTVQAALPAIQP